jgi:hypothetical protein
MLDMLPNQSKEYPGWKSWLVVARLKTMATWMYASGSVSDSCIMAEKSYDRKGLSRLPYKERHPRSCPAHTSGSESPHPASEARCQVERHNDKACIPTARQSVTQLSQPLARIQSEQSPTPFSVGSQEASPSLPSQARGHFSSSRTLSQDQCSSCVDVVIVNILCPTSRSFRRIMAGWLGLSL